jgi:hypothetical protein
LEAAAPQIETQTEVPVADVEGRPDIGVASNHLLCGFVELKAPGKGARPQKFTGADKRQWEKFKALPNLIYTDGNEWALFRSGKPWPEDQPAFVRFSGDITADGADAISEIEAEKLHQLLLSFFNWQPIVPSNAGQLAQMLAPLCHYAREDVLRAISNDQSNLAQLAREWRNYLFPDADNAKFADAYAQTLTYALLLARLNGEARLTTESAGRFELTMTSYALNAGELSALRRELDRDNLDTTMQALAGDSGEAITDLVKQVEALVAEPVKEKEPEPVDPNPFASLFAFRKTFGSENQKSETGDETIEPVVSDSEIERVIRSQVILDARRRCLRLYNRCKSALKMPVMDN